MTELQPRLSVCIPTFNRFSYLSASLSSLLPEAEELGVEVCISENHSTDETPRYLEGLVRQYRCLSVNFNSRNIGLEANMAQVSKMATGAHVLLLGDDDFIPIGNLKKIIDLLSPEMDLLVLNCYITDRFLSPLGELLSTSVGGETFLRPDSAFEALWDKMPFGAFISARPLLSGLHKSRFIGTSHAYTGIIWDSLADYYSSRGTVLVQTSVQPLILLRGAEKSWKSDAGKIFFYEIPLWFRLVSMKTIYSEVATVALDRYLRIQMSWWSLLDFRAKGIVVPTLPLWMRMQLTKPELVLTRVAQFIWPTLASGVLRTLSLLRKAAKFVSRRLGPRY